MLQLTMTKPRKTVDFFTHIVQNAFRDVSVVISGNKLQTKSAGYFQAQILLNPRK